MFRKRSGVDAAAAAAAAATGIGGDEDYEDPYALTLATIATVGGSSGENSFLDHHDASSTPGLPRHVCDPTVFPFTLGGADPETVIAAHKIEAFRATQHICDEWIRAQMRQKAATFTTHSEVTMWMGTFNVNGKKPDTTVSVEAWVTKFWEQGSLPQLVVVGFQEIVDLNVSNALTDAQTIQRAEQWEGIISGCLQRKGGSFQILARKSLVGLHIVCFVSTSLSPNIRNVQTAMAATGVFGMVGNKGACAIRFEVFDSSVCVVCAHLAAHQDAVETRNQNVRDINIKTTFPLDSPPRSAVPERHHPRVASTSLNALQASTLTIQEHDYLFWIGDFNYRLDGTLSPTQVIQEIAQQNLMSLREMDQLEREMKMGRVFSGLSEVAPLTFFPTYKFEPGTDVYDQRPEKKVRAPAWTDRILGPAPTSTSPGVECLGYGRVDEVRVSDHKPVCALIKFQTTHIVDSKREVAYKELLKRLGEKQEVPASSSVTTRRVTITPPTLEFVDLGYKESAEQTLRIKNEAPGVIVWRFAPRPGDDVGQVSSNNVRIDKAFGLLMPGETALVQVSFRPRSCAQRLITDALVIHALPLKNQRDALGRAGTLTDPSKGATTEDVDVEQTVVMVKCTTRTSIFGAVLHTLVQPNDGQEKVPSPLIRLVSKLFVDKSLETTYRLFLTPVDPAELSKVRVALDRNEEFHELVSPHCLAMAIIEFLDRLDAPVVPPEIVMEDFTMTTSDTFDAVSFYNALSPLNANVLALMVSIVKKLLAHVDVNRASLSLLSPIFAYVLFRPNEMADFSKEQSAVKATGFGEFTSWITSSAQAVMGTNGTSQDKAKDRAAWEKATVIFQELVVRA